jgi:hypothetical protein
MDVTSHLLSEGIGLIRGIDAAQWIGLVAVFFMCSWPLLKHRKHILAFQATGSLAFAIHYAMVGANTAAVLCLLIFPHAVLALLRTTDHWRWARWVYLSTAPFIIVVLAMTWQGWWSGFVAAGVLISMWARSRPTVLEMRLGFLPVTLCWVTYNLTIGSTPGLISDAILLSTNLWGIRKELRKRNAAKLDVPAAALAAS